MAWVVVAGLVILHFLLHVGFGLDRTAPDLLTVALLLSAREVGMGPAAGIGLFFGLLEDALSVLSFGANAVAMTVLGALGALTRDLFVGDSFFFLFFYFLLGKWARDLMHWLMVGPALRPPFVETFLLDSLLAGLYAAAVGTLIMAFTGYWREARP